MVFLAFELQDGNIVVPQDIEDPVERDLLTNLRDSVYKIIGSLQCPHKEQLCGIQIAIKKNHSLKIINLCHEDFAELISETLRKENPAVFFLER